MAAPDDASPARRDADEDALFAHRYSIGRELGRGGMATVHHATDTATGRELAIKRLLEHPKNEALALALFEQEFHVLSQLEHPRVVEAVDYGVAGGMPFYTMELLDGGDLASVAPISWRDACGVFRDVFSVLALLHSRRMVYRDLNPKNIRRTADGTAKLIDFGAMMPMGPTRKVVGTPGFTAPELLHQQSVDGRADLYAAGAAMYYALTGRAPHRARNMAELAVALLVQPERPSRFDVAEDCPPELEELIMELLLLDPAFRPASAAEVTERLMDIGGLAADELLPTSGAYLVTPPLMGRDADVAHVRKRITKAGEAKGTLLFYESAAGTGRSRMLEAAALEAKLAGALVARADVGDARTGDYGVADRLAAQVLEQHPDAPSLANVHADVIGHALRSVRAAHPEIALKPFSDPRLVRPAVQTALQTWLLSLCEERMLVLVVDDLHRIDEPSLALLALLTIAAPGHQLLLVCSAEQRATAQSPTTLATIRLHARRRTLENLCEADTHALVAAVFGDSPQVALVSERIFSVCLGNPRDILQLAEFLVAEEIACYEGGRWLLPTKLDAQCLPSTAEEASTRAFENLGSDARTLAQLFALSALGSMTLEDCAVAMQAAKPADTLHALGELTTANVIRIDGGHYSFSRPLWAEVAQTGLTTGARQAHHQRLADMISRRGHAPMLRLHHLHLTGDDDMACDALVAFCRNSVAQTDDDNEAFHRFVTSLPDNWYALFDWGIRTAERTKRPRRDTYIMRLRLTALLGLDPSVPTEHASALMAQLKRDAGLDLYESLESKDMPHEERLKQALEGAQARYEAASDGERVLPPLEALRPLVQSAVGAAGSVVAGMDYGLLAEVPDLRPIEAFSPMIAIVRRLIDGLRYRLAGRVEQAEASYASVLERLEQLHSGGVDPVYAMYTRWGITKGLAMMEAAFGLDRVLERADFLDGVPLMGLNASTIRMLHCYFNAQAQKGDALKRDQVLVRIKESAIQWYEGNHLTAEVIAHSAARDATRLRATLSELEVLAERHAGWRSVLTYGQAEFAMLHGRHGAAHRRLTGLMAALRAGQHEVWSNAAGAHVASAIKASTPGEAVELGKGYLAEARQAQLGIHRIFVRIPVAEARLAAGDLEGAHEEADSILQLLEDRGVKGLLAGNVREISAWIAIARGDKERAQQDVKRLKLHLRADANRRGKQRYERLLRALNAGDESVDDDASRAVTALQSELRSRIGRGGSPEMNSELWHRALVDALIDETGATAARLFLPDTEASDGNRTLRCVMRVGCDGEDETKAAEAASTHFTLLAHLSGDADGEAGDEFATQTGFGGDPAPGGLESFVLCHSNNGQPRATGLITLLGPENRPRSELLEALSRLIVEAGSLSTESQLG